MSIVGECLTKKKNVAKKKRQVEKKIDHAGHCKKILDDLIPKRRKKLFFLDYTHTHKSCKVFVKRKTK
jgi:hypothetical protein